MNVRWIFGFALGSIGLCWLAAATAQEGAVLRNPFDPLPTPSPPLRPVPNAPSPTPKNPSPMADPAALPDSVRSLFPNMEPAVPASPDARRSIVYEEPPDINRDLQITPAAGNWLIMVISYPGKNGATQARKMCLEIREKNRVPAYVFVYGAEERRKEYERVKKIVDQQQAFYKQSGLSPNQPVRIPHRQIDVHHTVLIGGYPDDESAKRALNVIQKWPQPDEKKVDLEVKVYSKPSEEQRYYVNPFKRAFICRNPSIKHDAPKESKLDIAALRNLNADEPYSLLQCKKPYTLAVKEFQTPHMVPIHESALASMWDKVTGSVRSERLDGARINAHNLAEMLRKSKSNYNEIYVLHAKYSSTVTIGGFDSPDDPALKSMQEMLAKRFGELPNSTLPNSTTPFFFHRPVPMAVPR